MAKTADAVEAFSFKAGWVEGNVYDAKGIEEISKIPSKEVLIAKVLGGFNAPITSLAYVIKAIAEKQEANA
jgi:large subunit ribosomal protein L10